MSIAVPVILLVLLSAQVYKIWQNDNAEQTDKSEQADESSSKDNSNQADKSSSKKDKSGNNDKSSPAVASKGTRHPQTKHQD
jgi:cytoskeletal protein RodZ